jgi:hypothetical protein
MVESSKEDIQRTLPKCPQNKAKQKYSIQHPWEGKKILI